ncbi:unnamed protein product, partial [marine sediment metagenome]
IERLKDSKPIGVCGLVYINWVIKSADVSFYIGENSYETRINFSNHALFLNLLFQLLLAQPTYL